MRLQPENELYEPIIVSRRGPARRHSRGGDSPTMSTVPLATAAFPTLADAARRPHWSLAPDGARRILSVVRRLARPGLSTDMWTGAVTVRCRGAAPMLEGVVARERARGAPAKARRHRRAPRPAAARAAPSGAASAGAGGWRVSRGSRSSCWSSPSSSGRASAWSPTRRPTTRAVTEHDATRCSAVTRCGRSPPIATAAGRDSAASIYDIRAAQRAGSADPHPGDSASCSRYEGE